MTTPRAEEPDQTNEFFDEAKLEQRFVEDDETRLGWEALLGAGCDRGILLRLLIAIDGWSFRMPLSPADVRSARQQLGKTVRWLFRIEFSEFGTQIFDRLKKADNLRARLEEVGKRLDSIKQVASAKNRAERDRSIGAVVRYVKQTTGRVHDDDLSPLLKVVLEKEEWSAAGQREWRQRHRALWDD